VLVGQVSLCRHRSRHRISRPVEGKEAGIAGRIELASPMAVTGGSQNLSVLHQHIGVSVAEYLQESGGAFHVAEKQGYGPAGRSPGVEDVFTHRSSRVDIGPLLP
jgi:hypothetical protein